MDSFIKEYSKILDESNSHISFQALAAYLNLKDVLSSKERQFIEKHLANCTFCKERLEVVKAEDSEFDSASDDAGNKPGIFSIQKYRNYAAAAVIIIALAAVFYLSSDRNEEPVIAEAPVSRNDTFKLPEIPEVSIQSAETENENPSAGETSSSQQLAAAFSENSVLENFINRNVRSETQITLLSPSIGDTIDIPYMFEWKTEQQIGDSDSFNFIVVNNKNKIVYQRILKNVQILFEEELNPGLYYWKLEFNGELKLVSKFIFI